MNERIRELAEQAGVFAGDFAGAGLYSIHNKEEVEKFAELIVKECAKTAYLYASDSKNYKHYDDLGWDCLPGDLQSHIKEHFGVEE